MPSKTAKLVPLGIVLAWLLAAADSRLLAANHQPRQIPQQQPGRRMVASYGRVVHQPAAENVVLPGPAELTVVPAQPAPDQGLDLLTSPARNCGDCNECASCGAGQLCASRTYCLGHFWFRGDYLIWWTRPARLPPLVTTSMVGAPIGTLDQSTTDVLFGDQPVEENGRSGFRTTLGYWLNCCQTIGIQGDYFDLGKQTDGFRAESTGEPVLARPYFDVQFEQPAAEIIAYPGQAFGDVEVRTANYFQSAGGALRYNLLRWQREMGCATSGGECGYGDCFRRRGRLDAIGGYRYYRFTDGVTVHEHVVSTNQPPLVAGTLFDIVDDFQSSNEFNGAELGLTSQTTWGRWSLDLLAKMALGNNHQTVAINGSTAITVPGFPTDYYTGGLLALQNPITGGGNIGTYSRNDFVVIPQFGLELGYQLSCRVRAYVGYNFIFWANVVRSGEQVNLNIDPRNLPNAPLAEEAGPEPTFSFHQSDFWAQGIDTGLEIRF